MASAKEYEGEVSEGPSFSLDSNGIYLPLSRPYDGFAQECLVWFTSKKVFLQF